MKMKIKTKLISGVGLLFALIVLLATLSIQYIYRLKQDTNNILIANYNTLEYARNMLLALDDLQKDGNAITAFEKNLNKQLENVTETGEKDITIKIAEHFKDLKTTSGDGLTIPAIRKEITRLMQLNMSAIERKSNMADHTARSAISWISVTGTLCFLIAFILLVNLPGNIADPIAELTESIKQIARQNYKKRVHFESNSEFGELARSFNIMAEKLDEYSESKLARILKEKKRIETLINNMHDPVIGIDEEGKILFANNEYLHISGLKGEYTIGEPIYEVAKINDLTQSLVNDMLNSSVQKRHTSPVKIFANNRESYFEKELVEIKVIPTGESAPMLIGHVIILRNITTHKELDSAKTNFIATISHEFKTPISSIKMGLQLLENKQIGILNSEQQQLLEGIKDDAERLLRITGELLDMTQVESGNIQLAVMTSEAREILDYAIQATRVQAEQKQIMFHISVPEQLPKIWADSEKTAWVLINFISNAIRYSPENTRIIIRLVSVAEKVRFEVEDQGKGIENRYKERIFDRYFQVPGSLKTGTGLGLAISKEFVEAQEGKIGVKDAAVLGSVFWFELKASV